MGFLLRETACNVKTAYKRASFGLARFRRILIGTGLHAEACFGMISYSKQNDLTPQARIFLCICWSCQHLTLTVLIYRAISVFWALHRYIKEKISSLQGADSNSDVQESWDNNSGSDEGRSLCNVWRGKLVSNHLVQEAGVGDGAKATMRGAKRKWRGSRLRVEEEKGCVGSKAALSGLKSSLACSAQFFFCSL